MPRDIFLEMNDARRRVERLRASHDGEGCQAPVFRELEAVGELLAAAAEELTVQDQELTATAEMARLWRRHYEELFQFAPDGYLVTDQLGVIQEANRAAADLLGVSPEFLAGKPLPRCVAHAERADFRARLRALQPEAGRQEWEVSVQPRRRPSFGAFVTVAAAPGPNGGPPALRWLLRDATARKAAETEHYRRLLSDIQDYAIVALDDSGRILTWNVGAARMFGYAEDEVMGRPIDILFTPEDVAAGVPARERQQAAETGRASEDRWHRRKDGSRFWGSGALTASHDRDGLPRSFVKVLRDFTDRRRAQEDLTEAYERERNIAGALQRDLLPDLPEDAFPGVSVVAQYEAARPEAQVGGDFYDAFWVDERRVALVVGDVSGKGLGAASRTAEVKTALRVFLREHPSSAEALRHLNEFLCADARFPSPAHPGRDEITPAFVALSLVVIEARTGEAEVAAAGAEPPLLLPGDGDAHPVAARGRLLGVEAGVGYGAARLHLASGDTLLQVTDGITEARRGRQFLDYEGMAALAQQALEAPTLSEAARALMAGARDFAEGCLQDDACLLMLRRR